jgi:hypothetical protein
MVPPAGSSFAGEVRNKFSRAADEFAGMVAAGEAGYSIVFTSILSPRPAHARGLSVLKISLQFKIAGGMKAGSDGGTNQSVTAVTYRGLSLCVKTVWFPP